MPQRLRNKLLKLVVYSIILVVIVSIGTPILYYTVRLRPHLIEIDNLLEKAPGIYINPTSTLSNTVHIANDKEEILSWVARSFVYKYRGDRLNPLEFAFHEIVWNKFLKYNYSENDLFALWCHFFRYENGIGLQEASLYTFQRSVDTLTPEEIFILIAKGESPDFFNSNPEGLKYRVGNYFRKYSETYMK
jgi:hypothetical protein